MHAVEVNLVHPHFLIDTLHLSLAISQNFLFNFEVYYASIVTHLLSFLFVLTFDLNHGFQIVPLHYSEVFLFVISLVFDKIDFLRMLWVLQRGNLIDFREVYMLSIA